MHNTIGKKVPDGTMKQWLQELERLQRELAPYVVTLSAGEKRRRLRLRPEAEAVLDGTADLAEAVGLELPTSVESMREDKQLVQELRALLDELVALQVLILDTRVQAEHEAWSAAQAYYTAIQRVAGSDPVVYRQFQPIARYFARPPRRREPVEEDERAERGDHVSRDEVERDTPPAIDDPIDGAIGTV